MERRTNTNKEQAECPFQFTDTIDCELGAKMISSNTGQMGTQQNREQQKQQQKQNVYAERPKNNIINVLKLFALVSRKWRTNFPNISVMYYLHICRERSACGNTKFSSVPKTRFTLLCGILFLRNGSKGMERGSKGERENDRERERQEDD